MLIETPTVRPAAPETTETAPPADTAASAAGRRRHDDAPDTMALFGRLADLEDGPERDGRWVFR
jgi:RNA polymerase sigma-B factor